MSTRRIAFLFSTEAAAFAVLALALADRHVHRRNKQNFSVVNLAEPRGGADSYGETLRHYAFLEPDITCVFDGYDALTGLPPHARQRSLVFRATGYLPLLPSRLLGQAGWMSDPDGGVADVLLDGRGPDDISCRGGSAAYCNAMADTVRVALDHSKAVVVFSPPAVSSRHLAQQQSLGAALTQAFGHDQRFTYLDFTSAIDLSNTTNSPDRVHRTLEGNHVIAQRLASAILKRLPSNEDSRGNRGRF